MKEPVLMADSSKRGTLGRHTADKMIILTKSIFCGDV